MDRDRKGGNPFASAFVEAIQTPHMRLSGLGGSLVQLTDENSNGFQKAEVPNNPEPGNWEFAPATSERRVALVLVYSDYAASNVSSLPGAVFDSARVGDALRNIGFDAAVVVDPADIEGELQLFANRAAQADIAIIYTTGHGVEIHGQPYLLPGTFRCRSENAGLQDVGIPLSSFVASAQARLANLLFFGGCRSSAIG